NYSDFLCYGSHISHSKLKFNVISFFIQIAINSEKFYQSYYLLCSTPILCQKAIVDNFITFKKFP
ncbi:hypothetical protein, partial [Ehrlichia ruminantium]|uniref:hypothetical protein n=1 Tax=Ehrlichia ruminantium TaxID=779 RepID=UPI001F2A342E